MIINFYWQLLMIIDYYWWSLLMVIEKDCDKINFSSNINEVIRPVLFFFYDKITNTKSTKKHQKALKNTKKHQKALKNTTNLRFIKLKKHLIGKNNFFFFYDKIIYQYCCNWRRPSNLYKKRKFLRNKIVANVAE